MSAERRSTARRQPHLEHRDERHVGRELADGPASLPDGPGIHDLQNGLRRHSIARPDRVLGRRAVADRAGEQPHLVSAPPQLLDDELQVPLDATTRTASNR